MMKTDAWMPLYVGDLLADTLHLSRADFGSYMLLICAYWRRGGPLPDNDAQLASIARTSLDEWRQDIRLTLATMFEIEGGCWRHNRIEKELRAASAAYQSRCEAGKLGVEARKRLRSTAGQPAGDQSQSQSQGIHIHRESTDVPVEFPPHFPKTEQEAIEKAPLSLQEQKAFIVDTWHKAASRGGRDAKDVPVRNWSSFLAIEWKYAQNRKAEAESKESAKRSGKPLTIEDEAVLRRREEADRLWSKRIE